MTAERILVVCAVRAELRRWRPRPSVDIVAGGVGPVEAALATALAVTATPYALVINAGIAGAFRGSAAVGDGVVVAEERLADIGLEGGASLTLPDGQSLVDRAFASDELLARIVRLPYRVTSGVTVFNVTTTEETAVRLRERYDAQVESMEGFAVLRACERAHVPALEVRGISNYVGARAQSEWDFEAGARACTTVLDATLDALGVRS